MKYKFIIPALLFAIIIGAACQDSHTPKPAEDAQDAGREFIRASLDGNYESASFYLYPDSTNKMLFDKWKTDHQRLDHEEQKNYRNADIRPINIQALNDSVSIYTYTNTYKPKDTTTIRIIRVKGMWLVDLKEILNSK